MEAIEGEKRTNPIPARSGIPLAAKRRIVELFATFHGVSAVRVAILSEFNLALDERTICQYDPSRKQCRIGARLRELYEEVRTQYVEDTSRVAIAHQAHRLRLLTNLVAKAEKARDFGNAIKGLELAAREMGGQLTNVQKREVSGQVEHRHLSVEDAKAELAMRLGAFIDRGELVALPSPDTEPQAGHSDHGTEEPKAP